MIPLDATYTGAEEGQDLPVYDAVTVTGGRKGDVVTYQLGAGEETGTIPQIQYAGTYSVTVRVQREHYEPYEQTYQAVLKSKANVYSGTYDGDEHPLIRSIEGTDPEIQIQWWNTAYLNRKKKQAGQKIIPKRLRMPEATRFFIRIDRDHDNVFEETIDAIATIKPASMIVENTAGDQLNKTVEYDGGKTTYDYSVKDF
mgnify:CR=1 FL=1